MVSDVSRLLQLVSHAGTSPQPVPAGSGLHQVPVHQRSLCNEQNADVAAVVQSKHDLQCLKQNTVYKEYDSRQGSDNVASRPASGRQARSDGRLRFSYPSRKLLPGNSDLK